MRLATPTRHFGESNCTRCCTFCPNYKPRSGIFYPINLNRIICQAIQLTWGFLQTLSNNVYLLIFLTSFDDIFVDIFSQTLQTTAYIIKQIFLLTSGWKALPEVSHKHVLTESLFCFREAQRARLCGKGIFMQVEGLISPVSLTLRRKNDEQFDLFYSCSTFRGSGKILYLRLF